MLSSENIYTVNILRRGIIAITTNPADPKRSYHHGNLKAALIDAGIALLEEEGLGGLSLRAIAARVGVSHTAPKNHFGSLRGLTTAIATEGFLRHAAFTRHGVSEASDPQTRLLAAMEGYVRFAAVHPALFSLMFSAKDCDFSDPDMQAAGGQSYAVLAGIAKGLDWDKAGLPGADVRAERMLWSLVHGFAQLTNAGLFGAPHRGDGPPEPDFGIGDIMPAFSYLPMPGADRS